MANGFIEADVSSTVTLGAISSGDGATAYEGNWAGTSTTAGVPLTQSSSVGSGLAMPTAGVKWSHLELIIQDSASTNPIDHTIRVFFSWDSAGTQICAGPSDAAEMVLTRAGSSTTFMCAIDLDMIPSLPPEGTANVVYMWLSGQSFNQDTPELKRARLYWYDIF
ncbi:MAG TPA: hypothetical protein DCW74_16420 [Alteromonas australica]|mgnify:FL=1|uniref:Uncharacterized protein n=1 Tax=Alteromonas australica TaxID=589873 RepID=A0A350P7P0_9ALTE|nr:hypothetical protein [Alteromonas australica]|tara:strand:- start:158 stop:652 length:495 start_codon:yes stop_codon:yes gene_type:complete